MSEQKESLSSSDTNELDPIHLEKLPHWFVPAAGIIYATGFLIIFTFMERFNVRETGDFFKVKYIHAGIMYWLFPIIVVVPLYSFYLLWRLGRAKKKDALQELERHKLKALEDVADNRESRSVIEKEWDDRIADLKKNPPAGFQIYVPSAVLVVNLLLVFYVFAIFAPPGFASGKEYVIPVIFSTTLIGIILIRVATSKLTEGIGRYARWLLCLGTVLGLDWYAFSGLLSFLWGIVWGGGKYFLIFLFLIPVILDRTRIRLTEIQSRNARAVLRLIAFCLVFALYYLSVLAFALRLYPYIPVIKGGGDYYNTPNVVLCFQEGNAKLASPDLSAIPQGTAPCLPSKPLQIIEETSTSIFVADPTDGGPAAWRIGKKPIVFEIRRDRIASITYLKP